MVNRLCLNRTILHAEDFTEPSFISGYYIALASLVCLVLMLYDIFVAIRHRKYWFPCSLFPLGSFTVSLVTVATQITNDQTTIMPTALDQLSKLTGTAMICICMGFFMPSLGTMRLYECLSNMASWSFLVITAIVNIYQQISSGMVFVPLFIVEHAIIIFCLVELILVLWYCSIQVFQEKEMADLHADLQIKTSGSMFKRLRYCYVYGYISNPQLILCRSPLSTTVGILCSLCSLVAIEAGVRSLFLRSGEPCEVASKYESSLTMVVVIQILFVLVGGLAVLIRLFTFAWVINLESSRDNLTAEVEHLRLQFIFYNGNIIEVIVRIVIVLVLFIVVCSNFPIWLPTRLAARIPTSELESLRTFLIAVGLMKDKNVLKNDEVKNELKTHGIEATEWILRKGQGDYERWVKLNVRNSVNHLYKFLSSNHDPNQEPIIKHKIQSISPPYKVSCLSLVILAKFAASAFPNDTESIVQTLDEVFKIIYFIDEKTFEANPGNRRKRRFSKVWLGDKCSRNINSCLNTGELGEFAQDLRSKLKERSRFLFVCHEVEVIQQLIESGNEKQVLAYMLRTFLAKLPIAIHEDVTQSQPEQYEKRVKVAIKFLCKLKPVKDQIQWEFPHAETAFTSLLDDSDFTDIDKK